ncbi:hypothetical protein DLM_2468 [Aquitalea magnusonii]|uniref:Uncharacterized protein n=1 Tax=Aquitalea magnusonii TaxID=332411 RepID=A0A3G9GF29_9NEIS|nr:hypothetical protein DLM_2468 [Aquitalea magnusonii]
MKWRLQHRRFAGYKAAILSRCSLLLQGCPDRLGRCAPQSSAAVGTHHRAAFFLVQDKRLY